MSLYHPRQEQGTTLDYQQTLDWLLANREQMVTLLAFDQLYGIGPERDDLRAQGMTVAALNHARTIAMQKLPAEVQPSDLVYLKAKSPDPKEKEREALERARRASAR